MSPDRKRDLRRFRCAVARTRAFLGDSEGERGMAATEFALILPVALVLLTGVFTFGMVNQINQKVTITARTITDLVAQCSEIASADMSTMLNATAQVMSPFSASNTTVIVSEVQVPATGNSTIVWSAALSGSALSAGATVTLPSGMTAVNTPPFYLVWGHVSYTYTPTIGYNVVPPIILSDDFYISPRVSNNGQIYYPPQSGQVTTCD